MIQFTRSAKNFFFDRAAVLNAIDERTHKSMNQIGGRIRVTAQRSMRPSKPNKKGEITPSKPGKPPKRYGSIGQGLTEIYYNYDPTKRRVQVGPVKANYESFPEATVPEVHEFGKTVYILEAEFAVAGQPDQKEWRQVNKRGAGNARRYNRPMRRKNITYPKRPFMGPALEKNMKFIRDQWANALTSAGA